MAALLLALPLRLASATLTIAGNLGVYLGTTVKALLPFYAALFAVLMAVTYIPMISLWLPSVVL